MADWQIVFLKIAAMFLVILAGWSIRRWTSWNAQTTATLSRFVVDVSFPALVFAQMIRTVDVASLRQAWFVPLLGMFIIGLGEVVGLCLAPGVRRREQRRTFVFLVSIPNWSYLPLPIAGALFGSAGLRTVLLYNVGAQIMLWSLGVGTLRRGMTLRESLQGLARNPGLITTLVGVGAALAMPGLRIPDEMPAGASALQLGWAAVLQGMTMLGDLTIPLSLVLTGAQLGELAAGEGYAGRALWGVLGARLLIVPLLVIALAQAVARCGIVVPELPRLVGYLIAAMPVAVSCSIFTERFGGDTALASRSIFVSTLLSLVTVPAMYFLVRSMGL